MEFHTISELRAHVRTRMASCAVAARLAHGSLVAAAGIAKVAG
jgi:hypothetical protein